MIDWKMVLNVVATAVVTGALAGATSYQQDGFASPWQKHAAVAGITALGTLVAHLRQSPLPEKK